MRIAFGRARRAAILVPLVSVIGLAASTGSGSALSAPTSPVNVQASLPTVDPSPIILPLPTPTPSPLSVPSTGGVLPAGTTSSTSPTGTTATGTGGTGTGTAVPGAGASPSGAPAGPPISSPEQYQPSPQEQADLPDNNPQRLYYEGEQLILADQFAEFEKQFGQAALQAGGGAGEFGPPLISMHGILISQLFGCTSFDLEPYNPGCNSKHWHTGIDMVAPQGTPVFAADSGVVRVFRDPGGYGNHVVIIHGNGFVTLYGHLSAFAVQDGQVVRRGDLVGLVGSTGFSTGPHLHFEIRHENTYLDPCAFIGCQG
jgi:peptidase M23-like protein